MKKTLAALGLVAVAALALAGCSDSAATPESTTGGTTDTGGGEMRDVRVAALPIAETGALWAAIDAGIFEEHGLNVEIAPTQGGAQAIPALLSGDIDFAIGQPMGPIRADLQDLGVVIFSNYASSHADGTDVNSVVAGSDRGISGPADLAGKRVSVNSIGAAGDLTIRKAVDDAGGDSSTIEFIEVGFADVQAQIDAGNIDAGWVPDPFRGLMVSAGGVDVISPYQATIPGLTVLTNFTTQELLDSDPELVADYTAAMAEALDYATQNEDAVRAAIVTNPDIPEAVADAITLPDFTPDLDDAGIEDIGALALEYGFIDAEPDFDRLVQPQ